MYTVLVYGHIMLWPPVINNLISTNDVYIQHDDGIDGT